MPNSKREEKIKRISADFRDIIAVLDAQNLFYDMADTPDRIARMYVDEFFKNAGKNTEELDSQMTLFDADSKGDLILIRNIPFTSVCAHHLLPFSGKVNIAYAPNEKIFGLSKIPRVVRWFSAKPQLQEHLTKEIAEYIYKFASVEYVQVVIKAEHTCVACRGVGVDCETVTTNVRGNTTLKDISLYKAPTRFADMGGYNFD